MTLYPDPDLVAQVDLSACLHDKVLPLYKTKADFVIASPESDKRASSLFSEPHTILHTSEEDFYAAVAQFMACNKETFLDDIVAEAAKQHASDIHFFRKESSCDIQLRINGKMSSYTVLPLPAYNWVFMQLKLRSDCDISVTTTPQDGRFVSGDRHIRVSTLPTVYGEDIVCRLLDNKGTKTIEACGFDGKRLELIESMLKERSGLILVTGPTGSGKTTSLYAFLRHLQMQQAGTIVTLEDPVESVLDNVRQSQINHQSGFTFSQGLKAILRQDPDIIMVGEIRDKETAEIALNAAYTGHLVLSTLHTDDVASTLLRLKSFELDPFLVSYSLKGIVSQKLVTQEDRGRLLSAECLRLHNNSVESFKDMNALIELGEFVSFSEHG